VGTRGPRIDCYARHVSVAIYYLYDRQVHRQGVSDRSDENASTSRKLLPQEEEFSSVIK